VLPAGGAWLLGAIILPLLRIACFLEALPLTSLISYVCSQASSGSAHSSSSACGSSSPAEKPLAPAEGTAVEGSVWSAGPAASGPDTTGEPTLLQSITSILCGTACKAGRQDQLVVLWGCGLLRGARRAHVWLG